MAFGVFAILLSSVSNLYTKHRAIRAHISELKRDKEALDEKYQTVTSLNEYIETDDGREYVLRDKYRMIRQGEGLIVVTDKDTEGVVDKKRPALRRFWDSIRRGLGFSQ